MNEAGLLMTISQLAAIFSGFVAIFLVFLRQDGRFSPADSLRIRAIIFTSFSTLFGSLTPLLFWSYGVREPLLWKYAAIVWLILSLGVVANIASAQLKLTGEQRKESGLVVGVISWVLSATSMILVVGLIVGIGGAGNYILILLTMLAIAMVNFIALSLQKLL